MGQGSRQPCWCLMVIIHLTSSVWLSFIRLSGYNWSDLVYQSVCLSVYYWSESFYLSVCLLSIYLSVNHLSNITNLSPCISLFLYLCIIYLSSLIYLHLSTCISLCPSIISHLSSSIYMYISMSIYLCIIYLPIPHLSLHPSIPTSFSIKLTNFINLHTIYPSYTIQRYIKVFISYIRPGHNDRL